MAQITSEGAEQDSQPTNRATTTRTEQEWTRAGRGVAAEDGDSLSSVSDADKETALPNKNPDNDGGEPDGKLSEPGKSPAQGSLASSTDSAQEGSRVLRQEQERGRACPPPRRPTAQRARRKPSTAPRERPAWRGPRLSESLSAGWIQRTEVINPERQFALQPRIIIDQNICYYFVIF
ncbi:hypothetical protein KUCAC02_006607 [Chaenocephalus aceratus]|uniref:Uncharacterized protein n=1 Tax=Chaenocephalus aceratus TaxID=36190 RepID=A0ACB9VSZ6_CHAAC|nr:hypothetical protein KUCAC02_006607 [Chaenocephalus aceratus]